MAIPVLVDEQTLLQQLKRGNHKAFTRIYDHYWKKLLQLAWNHSRVKKLAGIVHEVFMSLWEKRSC